MRVHQDSPAATLGLKKFDIIAKIDDQKIFSASQLSQLIKNENIGDKITVSYIHKGKLNSKKVSLTAMPDKFARRTMPHSRRQMPFGKPPKWIGPFNHPGKMPDLGMQPFDMPPPGAIPHHQAPNHLQNQSGITTWSEFDSLSIQSMGKDQYHVEVSMQNSKGDNRKYTFEGPVTDIVNQIQGLKDISPQKKQKLIATITQGRIDPGRMGVFNNFDNFFDNDPYFDSLPPFMQRQLQQFNRDFYNPRY